MSVLQIRCYNQGLNTHIRIKIDGDIYRQKHKAVRKTAVADVFVAGSHVFKSDHHVQTITTLKH